MQLVNLVGLLERICVNRGRKFVGVERLISHCQQDLLGGLIEVLGTGESLHVVLLSERIWSWHEWSLDSILQVWSEEPGFLSCVKWNWSHVGGVLCFVLGAIGAIASATSVVSSLHGEQIAHCFLLI